MEERSFGAAYLSQKNRRRFSRSGTPRQHLPVTSKESFSAVCQDRRGGTANLENILGVLYVKDEALMLQRRSFQTAPNCSLREWRRGCIQQSVGQPDPAFEWWIPNLRVRHHPLAWRHRGGLRFSNGFGLHSSLNPSDGSKSQKVAGKRLTVNCVLLRYPIFAGYVDTSLSDLDPLQNGNPALIGN